MTKLIGTFSKIGPSKILVIGDFFLDTYTIGKARRISPEAPVAVVQVTSEDRRPGGAGNVVLNLISLGASVVAVGRIGDDSHGHYLKSFLAQEGANVQGILQEARYETPVKNRIIAENQQVVRIDYEKVVSINEHDEQRVIDLIPHLLENVDVVAISDYGKGFLSRAILKTVIEEAKKRNIQIIADPKGTDFSKYNGATIIKPNFSEFVAAANMSVGDPIEKIAAKLHSMIDMEILMVTRSEAGITLFFKDGRRIDFPVRMREVKDVTGAGDTVLATLACIMANGMSIETATELSNHTAGIAIERFGCARVTLSDLARRLLENDVENKVFDEEHLFALQQALHGRKFHLLAVEGSREGLSSEIFKSITKLALDKDHDLIVYVKDKSPCEDFVRILSSLHDVDFILLNDRSVKHVCDLLNPESIYSLHQSKLKKMDSPAELLSTC